MSTVDYKKIYNRVVQHIKNICPYCNMCNCGDDRRFPLRIANADTDDETLYIYPFGYGWCINCEREALEYNSKICPRCELYQDNERFPYGNDGKEMCLECYQDDCWYEDKAARHRVERLQRLQHV